MGRKPLAAAMAAALAWGAQDAMATNGDQMLGVTATQWGMAGAITAAPQDAGTVVTNPAGLAVIEMDEFRADMGFGFLNPPRKVNGTDSDSDLYLIPSGALGFRPNDRLSVGLGMAGMSGMGVDVPFVMGNNPQVATTKQFYKIAPGFAYKLNDRLALGAALNINYQSLAMAMFAGNPADPTNAQVNLQLPQNQVYGFGGSLGLIFQFSPRFQLGASYITKQNMDAFEWNAFNGRYSMTMDGPAQLAVGLAFRPSDTLLIEADVKRIEFSDVLGTVNLTTPMGVMPMQFGWEDQTVFAIAMQKEINPRTTVRLGFNYGESPIGPEDVDSNLGSLAVTEEHASLGVTRQMGKKVFGSLSYVRAFHNEVQSSTSSNVIELEQNVLNLQITYRN